MASGINDSPIILFADSGNSLIDNSAGVIYASEHGCLSYSRDFHGREISTSIGDTSLTLRQGLDRVSVRVQHDVNYGMVADGPYIEGYIRPACVAAAVLIYIALGPSGIPLMAPALGVA